MGEAGLAAEEFYQYDWFMVVLLKVGTSGRKIGEKFVFQAEKCNI